MRLETSCLSNAGVPWSGDYIDRMRKKLGLGSTSAELFARGSDAYQDNGEE